MSYEQDLLAWRQDMDDRLRTDSGWLTLVGLYWLSNGDNTVGSAPDCAIVLPAGPSPEHLGILHLAGQQVRLTITGDVPVQIDGESSREAVLRDDSAPEGPSLVKIGSVTFFIIKRVDQYGVRVRDAANPARATFGGRHWFAANPAYRVAARFIAHPSPRTVEVVSSVGMLTPMENPGYVEFVLNGQPTRLESFKNEDGDLWFIFRDGTSGPLTYKAGRFLVAPQAENGVVDLDFNRAYHPPCAFTDFATCPLPPRENILKIAIEAGEKLPPGAGKPSNGV